MNMLAPKSVLLRESVFIMDDKFYMRMEWINCCIAIKGHLYLSEIYYREKFVNYDYGLLNVTGY